jgi:hypothetical protein
MSCADPYTKLIYTCTNWTAAKQLMSKTVETARSAQWKHSECPEELESLQLLCQFLHAQTTHKDHKQFIEWVFTQLEMDHLLLIPAPSSSES